MWNIILNRPIILIVPPGDLEKRSASTGISALFQAPGPDKKLDKGNRANQKPPLVADH